MSLPASNTEDLTIPPVGLSPITMRMEQFNRAYIEALASAAGYNTSTLKMDDDSIDLSIKSRAVHGRRKAPQLDIQLKATTVPRIVEDNIKFDLPLKNYNDLRDDNIINPRILIVMLLPDDDSEWIKCNEEMIEMRKRAYWVSLNGKPRVNNRNTVRVDIPLSNIFNVTAIHVLLNKIGRQIDL